MLGSTNLLYKMSQMISKNYTITARSSSDLSYIETNILETQVLYFFIQRFEAFKVNSFKTYSSVFHWRWCSYYLKQISFCTINLPVDLFLRFLNMYQLLLKHSRCEKEENSVQHLCKLINRYKSSLPWIKAIETRLSLF